MKELTKDALIVTKDLTVLAIGSHCVGYTFGRVIGEGTVRLIAKFPKAAVPIAVGGLIASMAVPAIVELGVTNLAMPTVCDHIDDLKASIEVHQATKKNHSYKFSIA